MTTAKKAAKKKPATPTWVVVSDRVVGFPKGTKVTEADGIAIRSLHAAGHLELVRPKKKVDD